jgi:hypothetical protein
LWAWLNRTAFSPVGSSTASDVFEAAAARRVTPLGTRRVWQPLLAGPSYRWPWWPRTSPATPGPGRRLLRHCTQHRPASWWVQARGLPPERCFGRIPRGRRARRVVTEAFPVGESATWPPPRPHPPCASVARGALRAPGCGAPRSADGRARRAYGPYRPGAGSRAGAGSHHHDRLKKYARLSSDRDRGEGTKAAAAAAVWLERLQKEPVRRPSPEGEEPGQGQRLPQTSVPHLYMFNSSSTRGWAIGVTSTPMRSGEAVTAET